MRLKSAEKYTSM